MDAASNRLRVRRRASLERAASRRLGREVLVADEIGERTGGVPLDGDSDGCSDRDAIHVLVPRRTGPGSVFSLRMRSTTSTAPAGANGSSAAASSAALSK